MPREAWFQAQYPPVPDTSVVGGRGHGFESPGSQVSTFDDMDRDLFSSPPFARARNWRGDEQVDRAANTAATATAGVDDGMPAAAAAAAAAAGSGGDDDADDDEHMPPTMEDAVKLFELLLNALEDGIVVRNKQHQQQLRQQDDVDDQVREGRFVTTCLVE